MVETKKILFDRLRSVLSPLSDSRTSEESSPSGGEFTTLPTGLFERRSVVLPKLEVSFKSPMAKVASPVLKLGKTLCIKVHPDDVGTRICGGLIGTGNKWCIKELMSDGACTTKGHERNKIDLKEE